eukprot:5861238-Prymnesium_polylepis.1
MFMRCPLDATRKQLLLKHAAPLNCQLLGVADHEVVVHEDVEVDPLPGAPLPQLVGYRLCQAAEEVRGLDVPKGETSSPHELPSARMTHHHVVPGVGMDRHVEEAVPN